VCNFTPLSCLFSNPNTDDRTTLLTTTHANARCQLAAQFAMSKTFELKTAPLDIRFATSVNQAKVGLLAQHGVTTRACQPCRRGAVVRRTNERRCGVCGRVSASRSRRNSRIGATLLATLVVTFECLHLLFSLPHRLVHVPSLRVCVCAARLRDRAAQPVWSSHL
jgi:hypothetical protein